MAAFLAPGLAAQPAVRVIDLGHPLSASAPTWSGEPAYDRTRVGEVDKDGYTTGRFSADEHVGTHLDAPAHFGGTWTVDRIPVERLVRPAVRIDVSASVSANEDYQVTVEDLLAFERNHGRIPAGALVLVATGWDARWPSPRYMNARNGVKHFPGLSAEAAKFLAEIRDVAGIGIDTPSIDYGPSSTFEAHQASQRRNVYHIENAARLTTLPPTGFTVVVAPINLEGGSGGPARVFALLER